MLCEHEAVAHVELVRVLFQIQVVFIGLDHFLVDLSLLIKHLVSLKFLHLQLLSQPIDLCEIVLFDFHEVFFELLSPGTGIDLLLACLLELGVQSLEVR